MQETGDGGNLIQNFFFFKNGEMRCGGWGRGGEGEGEEGWNTWRVQDTELMANS